MAFVDWYNIGKLGRRIGQVADIVGTPSRQVTLRRLLGRARLLGLAAPSAVAPWKYLGNYLSLELDRATRYRIMLDHYRFLLARSFSPAVARHWTSGMTLWRSGGGRGAAYRIRLSQATRSSMEGECRLTFEKDDTVLWTLTFVIAQSQDLKAGDGMALVIGALQGGRDCLGHIRQATRENARLRPHAALLVATIGVARALALSRVIAIASCHRPVVLYRSDDPLLFDGDIPLLESGATRQPSGNLLLDLEKRPPTVTGSKRQLLKRTIEDEVIAALTGASAPRLALPQAAR